MIDPEARENNWIQMVSKHMYLNWASSACFQNLKKADVRIVFMRALMPETTLSNDLGKIMKNNYTYSFPVLVSES